MKFLHTADLHLGAQFKSISLTDAETARRLREATIIAYERIIQLAIDEEVDFVLFAGDVFNAEEDMQHAQLLFRRGIRRLDDAAIPSFVICGNHDPLARGQHRLALPESCTLFKADSVTAYPVVKDGNVVAQVIGISYATARVTEKLVSRFPMGSSTITTVGMLHGNLANSVGHENYAPFTLADLEAKGYDYWALGHIHIHQEYPAGRAIAVYPGSPQGLDPTETGPHGCVIVAQDSQGVLHTKFHEICPVQWESKEITCSAGEAWKRREDLEQKLDDLLDTYLTKAEATERSFALRINLTARTPLYHSFSTLGARAGLLEEYRIRRSGDLFVWVEQFDWNLRPDIDIDEVLLQPSFEGEVARASALAAREPAVLASYFTTDAAGLLWSNRTLDSLLADFKSPEVQTRLLEKARDLALDVLIVEEK